MNKRLLALLVLTSFSMPAFASGAFPIWPFVLMYGFPVSCAAIGAYLGWKRKSWLVGVLGFVFGLVLGLLVARGFLAFIF